LVAFGGGDVLLFAQPRVSRGFVRYSRVAEATEVQRAERFFVSGLAGSGSQLGGESEGASVQVADLLQYLRAMNLLGLEGECPGHDFPGGIGVLHESVVDVPESLQLRSRTQAVVRHGCETFLEVGDKGAKLGEAAAGVDRKPLQVRDVPGFRDEVADAPKLGPDGQLHPVPLEVCTARRALVA
jgi:hypothetical protein